MNETDIQPNVNSTDTHGTTDINFALLELCGYSFAPRYKELNKRSNLFYTPKSPKEYNQNYALKSSGKIDTALILSEEKNIKRIIASIMMKTATVSTIVKKLFHSPKSNKTRKAIAEFNKIFRTKYLLNYIDDLSLRQSVQIALNRGESYHQLKKNVSFANNGKIRTKSETEQKIYQESSRLICSSIIYFNSYILSLFLKQKNKTNQVDEIEALKRVSPIAWTHLNLYGKYDFSKNNENLLMSDLEKIIETINLPIEKT